MPEEKSKEVAIWLSDGYGRLLVGAAGAQKSGRWVTQGTIVEEIGAGVWLKTDTIQEFRPVAKGVKRVDWMFKSSQLLVRWDGIITIQVFEGGVKEIGFKAQAGR